MISNEVILIVILALVIAYWMDGMRAKEIARVKAKQACIDAEVEFLDDTVAQSRVKLRRNTQGQASLYREYQFEFTSDGHYRYHGLVTMLGKRVLQVSLDAYRWP